MGRHKNVCCKLSVVIFLAYYVLSCVSTTFSEVVRMMSPCQRFSLFAGRLAPPFTEHHCNRNDRHPQETESDSVFFPLSRRVTKQCVVPSPLHLLATTPPLPARLLHCVSSRLHCIERRNHQRPTTANPLKADRSRSSSLSRSCVTSRSLDFVGRSDIQLTDNRSSSSPRPRRKRAKLSSPFASVCSSRYSFLSSSSLQANISGSVSQKHRLGSSLNTTAFVFGSFSPLHPYPTAEKNGVVFQTARLRKMRDGKPRNTKGSCSLAPSTTLSAPSSLSASAASSECSHSNSRNSDFLINITQKAVRELQRLCNAERSPSLSFSPDSSCLHFRIGVRSGGCSGLSYSLSRCSPADICYDTDHIERHDKLGFRLVLDYRALLYLMGTTLDFSDELMGGGFRFENPNAVKSCGCGKSFGVSRHFLEHLRSGEEEGGGQQSRPRLTADTGGNLPHVLIESKPSKCGGDKQSEAESRKEEPRRPT